MTFLGLSTKIKIAVQSRAAPRQVPGLPQGMGRMAQTNLGKKRGGSLFFNPFCFSSTSGGCQARKQMCLFLQASLKQDISPDRLFSSKCWHSSADINDLDSSQHQCSVKCAPWWGLKTTFAAPRIWVGWEPVQPLA